MMSAFAGILNFDNERSVDPNLLIAFGNALAIHGPDGGHELAVHSIGMVFRAFQTNKHSRKEIQPHISATGTIVCWDGRLDNREDVMEACGLNDGELTDVELVSAVHARKGTAFLKDLVGDFAVSLWDPVGRTLMLARDPIGTRPLYYCVKDSTLFWCSELLALMDFAAVGSEVNDEYVAGHLTRGVDPHLTPYKQLFAVPPGRAIVFKNEKAHSETFWTLDPKVAIRYKTDEEYEEHFGQLFREAVRCRLRVNGPVWAQLSGGLDSSAIVSVADEILSNREVEATRLETVSYVYDEASSCDEREFVISVEENRGRKGYQLSDAHYPPLSTLSDDRQPSFPDFLDCFIERHDAMCAGMRHDGARVLLTGHGGDEMLGGGNPAPGFGDLLLQARLLSLHRALNEWSHASRKSYGSLLLRDGILPVLPRRAHVALGGRPNWKLPSWFDRAFVERMHLRDRYVGLKDTFGFKLPSARDQVVGLLSIIRFVAKTAYRDRGLIEVSHPYLHTPLVEFLQAIPFEQRVRPGQTKSLIRRTFGCILPPQVLYRKSKRGPDEALMRSISRQWPNLQTIFADARVCMRGYVDRDALLRALERARHGVEPYTFALIQTISLELWLRSLEKKRFSSTGTGVSRLVQSISCERTARAHVN